MRPGTRNRPDRSQESPFQIGRLTRGDPDNRTFGGDGPRAYDDVALRPIVEFILMRPRPWFVAAVLLAIVTSACSAASPTASPSAEEETQSEEASASTQASAEVSEQASEGATGGDELEYQLPPNFGDTDLTAGFTPDPFSVEVVSGGPLDASYLGGECRGFATAAPDFDVTYTAGSQGLLRFYFVAETAGEDTTLLVNAPDESWHCNDDATDSLNPQVDFEDPASGLYDIWIGSYESGTQVNGTLYVTEVSTNHP
jgi:hypothetical protein